MNVEQAVQLFFELGMLRVRGKLEEDPNADRQEIGEQKQALINKAE